MTFRRTKPRDTADVIARIMYSRAMQIRVRLATKGGLEIGDLGYKTAVRHTRLVNRYYPELQ